MATATKMAQFVLTNMPNAMALQLCAESVNDCLSPVQNPDGLPLPLFLLCFLLNVQSVAYEYQKSVEYQ
jgi:hypothetical protein